jgi:hypothetical protein
MTEGESNWKETSSQLMVVEYLTFANCTKIQALVSVLPEPWTRPEKDAWKLVLRKTFLCIPIYR